MREWLEETHGPGFELLRHFLLRFFDSDLVTASGQTSTALIGAFSILLPWYPMIVGPLRHKYAYFSGLPSAGPYRMAVRADELWLITLVMSATGLLTAIKWQSLFPGLRDYRVLGPLPLKTRQIFAAKLLALLIVATAAVVTLNLFPGTMFPAVSSGRWAFLPSVGTRISAYLIASTAGSYFLFFALTALQGVLLNLLPPRQFGRVTGTLQGLLVGVMLILVVLSFSIQPEVTRLLVQPDFARWLPPVWFLGLCQRLSGDPDPAMSLLAGRALTGLAVAIVVVLASYMASYRRHRTLLVEGAAPSRRHWRWPGLVFDRLMPDARQQAITIFIARTLAGSSQHRMILMGYGGFGIAILLSGLIGMRDFVKPDHVVAARFVYAHVILLIFLLIGVRHLFSIPIELKANWAFQITEREGRRRWLYAVDRFVLFTGATVMLVLPLPLEIYLLRWRTAAEMAMFTAVALLSYEMIFATWEKLPFTCSHLPGKTPAWILTLQFVGLLTLLPMVNGILLESLYRPILYLVVMAIVVAVWANTHATRRDDWGELRLKYEESPDPAVHGLNLMR
uniref:Uncharacterized protein n=1 Tax=Solibacter usitatus (strain Ellin6076) TaxID=234267 RepID=Q01YP6_SOLUE